MKKSLILILLVILLLMAGCSVKPVQQTQMPGSVEQESASVEETEPEETVISDETLEEADTQQEITDEAASAEEETKFQDYIYLPNEEFTALVKEPTDTEIVDVRQLVDQLVTRGVLPEGTAILSLLVRDSGSSYPYVDSTSKYVVGSQWIELDISSQFLQALDGRTAEQEALIMASLTNTLLGYFGLEEMTISCEGKQIETPNARYNYDLVFTEIE